MTTDQAIRQFRPGTDILKSARRKTTTFIVSESSSPAFEGDQIINYKANDTIDLPGSWLRKGQPLTLRRVAAVIKVRNKGATIDDVNESAFVSRRKNPGYIGLIGLDVKADGTRIKGTVLTWQRDEFNPDNNPTVFLSGYSGAVRII